MATPGVRIANSARRPKSTHEFEVIEPATEESHMVAGGGAEEAELAADTAHQAFHAWSETTAADRARILREIARILRQDPSGFLAETLTRETGKRLVEAQAEIEFSAAYFDWFADVISISPGELWQVVPGVRHHVRFRPLGVVAIITPWNFPVSIPARKIAPALAAGCTVVFRPSILTPKSSLALAKIVESVVEPGVINTVTGDAKIVTGTWLDDPRIRGISFTGSTPVGRYLAGEAGARLKRATLELGGRAPFIVFEDADPEDAADLLMTAKYRNNGQSCLAANNIWVHLDKWVDFVEAFTERTSELQLGDPLDPKVGLGPVRTSNDVDRLDELVNRASAEGAEIVAPVRRSKHDRGFFTTPKVALGVDPRAQLWQEEIFGPVTPIRAFTSLDEVIADSNGSSYGLSAYLITHDTGRALDVAAALEVGIVGVNVATPNTPHVPFGGMKASGYGGYEGGRSGIEPFLQYQSVAVGRGGSE